MKQRLRNLILQWLGIPTALSRINTRINQVEVDMRQATQFIKERTDVGIDIHQHDAHYIVCVGKYRGVDYVEAFQVPNHTFAQTIQECRKIQQTGNLRFVDAHPAFRAVLKRELG